MSTTLAEHLPLIEAASAPDQPAYLPEKVVEVLGEAREYARKVQGFVDHLTQKGADADALLDRVEKALQALKAQAEQEQPELEKALKEVEAELEKALGVQETEEGQLSSSVDAAGKAMDELKEKLQEAGRRAHQAQEKATSETSEVREDLTETQGEVDTILRSVAAGANEVEAQIAKMTGKMDSAMTQLKEKMSEYHGYVESRMGDLESRLQNTAGDNANDRREAMESLVGKSTALAISARERLEAMQEQVAEAMAQVAAAIGEVSGALTEAGTDAQGKCDDLDDPAAMLAASVPYMNGLVDKVKETAASLTQLRIHWPY